MVPILRGVFVVHKLGGNAEYELRPIYIGRSFFNVKKERQVKTYGNIRMVQLFLSVGSNIILDFLSDWNDRKHNSKFVAFCQKTSLYK